MSSGSFAELKAYARRTGKSVSELVADFFGRLEAPADEKPPRVVALAHLAERHR